MATHFDSSLLLYAELSPAEIRTAQRRLREGALQRIAPGVLTDRPEGEWPAIITRNRVRVLAALFPKAVISFRSAFEGGVPVDGEMQLTYGHARRIDLPGLRVRLFRGHGPAPGDAPMMARPLYFPSTERILLENLAISRSAIRKSAGRAAVEQRLIDTCDARGEDVLNGLRDRARKLAPLLGLEREQAILDAIIGAILGTRDYPMSTSAGVGLAAPMPYDASRIALFEGFAEVLRSTPLAQPARVTRSARARSHFAFLESYFSNFIEGTEFDVAEARRFVLEGQPITQRPKDSHDIIGVFHQALDAGWANQTMSIGESILDQLRARHANQMRERPEIGPGEFKTLANRAGNTEFVAPRLVRGTLVEASRLLPSVPSGIARALLAMFVVAEVHPFADGNGRLARLVMNAELSVVGACRIIVPTLFREEYLDCLRVLTRDGNPRPFVDAMQWIHRWTAAFDYEDLDRVIASMTACNAFERSRVQYKLTFPATT